MTKTFVVQDHKLDNIYRD